MATFKGMLMSSPIALQTSLQTCCSRKDLIPSSPKSPIPPLLYSRNRLEGFGGLHSLVSTAYLFNVWIIKSNKTRPSLPLTCAGDPVIDIQQTHSLDQVKDSSTLNICEYDCITAIPIHKMGKCINGESSEILSVARMGESSTILD